MTYDRSLSSEPNPAEVTSVPGASGVQRRSDRLPIGTALGECRVEQVIGSGSFGITYLGRRERDGAPFAIKEYCPVEFACRAADGVTVAPSEAGHAETFEWGLSRFLGEAEILARFRHPNIVSIDRFFRANGTAYIVMEFVGGRTLDSLIQERGRLEQHEILGLIRPLLSGVAEIHRHDILHRDIKPANILVRPTGVPVLIDFGSARAAVQARLHGFTEVLTPGYAPPEQYTTENQGPWTDVYGLAATLFKAVTGKIPPDAGRRQSLVGAGQPDPAATTLARGTVAADYSPALVNAIRAGLTLEPGDRPASVETLRSSLPTGEDEPTLSPRYPPPGGGGESGTLVQRMPPRPSPSGRTRLWLAGTCIVLISMMSGYVAHRILRPPVEACDRYAAYRYDPDRPPHVSGVSFGNIHAAAAIGACRRAVSARPELARLRFQLGRAYEKKADYANAAKHYQAATANGSAAAQWSLGLLLLRGRGVARDEREGLKLIHDAAGRGIVGAYISLGWHWWGGSAEDRDAVKAYYWYRRAEVHAPQRVRPALVALRKRLSDQQRAAVERRLAMR